MIKWKSRNVKQTPCPHFRWKSIISRKPKTTWPPSSVYRWNHERKNTANKKKTKLWIVARRKIESCHHHWRLQQNVTQEFPKMSRTSRSTWSISSRFSSLKSLIFGNPTSFTYFPGHSGKTTRATERPWLGVEQCEGLNNLYNCYWFHHQWFNMIIIDHSWSTARILNMTFDVIIDIIDQCLGWPWRVEGSERQAEHF